MPVTKTDVINTLNTYYGSTIYSDYNKLTINEVKIALQLISASNGGSGGGGTSGGATETTLSALNSKFTSSSGRILVDGSGVTQPVSLSSLPALSAGNNTIGNIGNTTFNIGNFPATQTIAGNISIADAVTSNNKLAINASGQIGISNFPSTQAVTIASLPALASGSNVIGSISNTSFAATQSGSWSVRNQDGNGNSVTSQVSGSQRALDVGINVAGVAVDPRSIRALTSSDVVSSVQSGTWNLANITGTISLPTGASTETTLAALSAKLPNALVGGRLSVDGSGVTQPVSLASLPALATGANTIGAVTQSGTWNINNISGTISLPTGAATSAKQAALGTAGSAATDVLTVQGISGMTALSVNQISSATTATITFTSSTTSSTFTITNRLAVIVCPIITGAPTLTLQISLDSGSTWVNTSVTLVTSASTTTIIESDSLARLSGGFGLSNAFRFSSSASITSATLNLRSIIQ